MESYARKSSLEEISEHESFYNTPSQRSLAYSFIWKVEFIEDSSKRRKCNEYVDFRCNTREKNSPVINALKKKQDFNAGNLKNWKKRWAIEFLLKNTHGMFQTWDSMTKSILSTS